MNRIYSSEIDTAEAAKKLISKKLFNAARDVVHVGSQVFPDSKHLQVLRAQIAEKMQDFLTSAYAYDKLLENEPNNPEFLINAAQAWNRSGGAEKALAYAQKFIDTTKKSVDGLFAKADIFERQNKPEESIRILESLDDKTRSELRWKYIEMRVLLATKDYEGVIDLVKEYKEQFENDSATDKSMASFSLCKAYDRLGEYDKAWAAAEEAHAMDKTPFDDETFFEEFDDLEKFMSREIVDALVEGPESDITPLFVVGNPRTGTSLLEQIMSMHPDIVNGGEMSVGGLMQLDVATLTDSFHPWPLSLLDMQKEDADTLSKQYFDAVDAFRTNEKVVTNKSPGLTNQLAFFSKVLPSARAIMLYRHPLDNAVSCYTTNLIASGHTYCNSLDTLGRTLIVRKRMIDCWLERLSIPMMELHYESLVANQREETQRIIEFLDLPWHEDCMEFHKSKCTARTISYDQVNQKMYTSSDGRWKNYEKHLGPLIDMFSDYI